MSNQTYVPSIGIEQAIKLYQSKHRNGRPIKGFDGAKGEWKITTQPICVEQWIFPVGSKVKAFETQDFGWLVFHPDTKDSRGFIPAKRIFRY